MENYLTEILKEHKQGKPVGIYSVCSANQFVLEAAMLQSKQENTSLLIECSANQVNQFGGYAGMDPDGFVSFLKECCGRIEFPFEMILLGGDHLGPNLWQDHLQRARSGTPTSHQAVPLPGAAPAKPFHFGQ